jgi:hypothetical protein
LMYSIFDKDFIIFGGFYIHFQIYSKVLPGHRTAPPGSPDDVQNRTGSPGYVCRTIPGHPTTYRTALGHLAMYVGSSHKITSPFFFFVRDALAVRVPRGCRAPLHAVTAAHTLPLFPVTPSPPLPFLSLSPSLLFSREPKPLRPSPHHCRRPWGRRRLGQGWAPLPFFVSSSIFPKARWHQTVFRVVLPNSGESRWSPISFLTALLQPTAL